MAPRVHAENDVEANRPFVSKVCSGDATTPVNVLCFLPVMLWNSFVVYIVPCVSTYVVSILDLLVCGVARIICGPRCWQSRDQSFPPHAASIGPWDGKTAEQIDAEIEWRRASEFFAAKLTADERKKGLRVKLFEDGVKPGDVAQGKLGDCWLLAAFACVAEHPALIRKMFLTKRASPSGTYRVQLFNGRKNRWDVLTVDEFIPIVKQGQQHLFANPNGREMWVVILEKAFAKWCGNYNALKGGYPLWAFNAITGDPVYALVQQTSNGAWAREDVRFVATNMQSQLVAQSAITFHSTAERYDSNDAFFLVRRLCRARTLIGAWRANAGEVVQSNGLVMGHAYSVLNARSFQDKVRASLRINLVQLRNPWGKHEWNGPWSDASVEWTNHPHIKALLKPTDADDGSFWMTWSDFSAFFDRLDVCQRSTGLRDLNIDLYEADGFLQNCAGPCKGCCLGCASYWYACNRRCACALLNKSA